MPLPVCLSNLSGALASVGLSAIPQPIDGAMVLQAAPTSSILTSGIEIVYVNAVLSQLNLELWLETGPGPVYTRQVRLAWQPSVVDSGTVVSSTWPLTTVLPSVGRPFDWTRDRFAYIGTYTWSTAPTGGSHFVNYLACAAATQGGGSDCCAETIAKLDQIIGFVSAQLHNQP